VIPRNIKGKTDSVKNVLDLISIEPTNNSRLPLQRTINEIASNWETDVYIDLKYLNPIMITNFSFPKNVILVVNFENAKMLNQKTGANGLRNGLCLRIEESDINRSGFNESIQRVLDIFDVPKSSIDLILDLKYLTTKDLNLEKLLTRIPMINSWRNLILSGGSFPKDLSGFSVGINKHPRDDWQYWRNQIELLAGNVRKPNYSDYTIIHPGYEPPAEALPSASFRYTHDREWIIFRGEKMITGGPGAEQYTANAQLLHDMPEYLSQIYSEGDFYVHTMSLTNKKRGNSTDWLQAGINHHLTHVVNQLSIMVGAQVPEPLRIEENLKLF
jgi:hypothetical protein